VTRLMRAGLLLVCGFLWWTPSDIAGQSPRLAYGASLVSRYVWRGVPYSSTPQIQPWASVTRGSLEFGVWGSYGVDGDYKEQNEWISLTHPLKHGSLVVALVDYYFTEDYSDFFDWSGVEGGVAVGPHVLEAAVTYTGPSERPLQLMLASTIYNDPEASVYGSAGYSLVRGGLTWSAEIGFLFQDGGYYDVGGGGLINLGLSASRALGSVGPLGVFVTGSLIHDAKLGGTYLVLEVGF